MNERWSQLTQAMVPVFERLTGKPLSDETRDLLEVIVEDLGLQTSPTWMVRLFTDILERNNQTQTQIPSGCPDGENGFSNLLLNIEQELFALGVDDYGEAIEWRIPSCGVHLVIDCTAGAPLLTLRRI